jgi:hypothetical protein
VTDIKADPGTLMRQASMTAHDYLIAAVENIDKMFGKGYAKEHPELTGAFIQAASLDFVGASLAKSIGEAIEGLADAVRSHTE